MEMRRKRLPWNNGYMSRQASLAFYSLFLSMAAACVLYGKIVPDRSHYRIWEWTDILPLLIGIPFVFLQGKAGLPELWEPKSSIRTKMLLPLSIGLVFGLADLLVIEGLVRTEPHRSLPAYTQPFPYSVFLYASGCFEMEVFYRLIPVTVLMSLTQRYAGPVAAHKCFPWVAILTSIREPLEQWPEGHPWYIAYSLATGLAMNMAQAVSYMRHGLAASVFLRLGHYLIWHILNGIYIQYVVLGRG